MSRKTNASGHEAEISNLLFDYLLVSRDSEHGIKLIDKLMGLYKVGKVDGSVNLQGDKFFFGMVEELLWSWGIETCQDCDTDSHNHSILYLPGPYERFEDFPLIISYMVDDILKAIGDKGHVIPKRICGHTIFFLLWFPEWQGFGQIYDFLQRGIAVNWTSERGVIVLNKLFEISFDMFKGDSKLVGKINEILNQNLSIRKFPRQESPSRRDSAFPDKSWLYYIRNWFWQEWMLDNGLASYYLSVDSSAPKGVANVFALESIGRIIENTIRLSKRITRPKNLSQREYNTAAGILEIRRSMYGDYLKKLKRNNKIRRTVWLGWSESAEKKILEVKGICDRKNYHSIMSRYYVGMRFIDRDGSFDKQTSAKAKLISNIILGKQLRLYCADMSVVYGDEKFSLTETFFKAVYFICLEHKNGNPAVTKQAIFDYCQVKTKSLHYPSIRKWFILNGGEAERFARYGLIETPKPGTCKIPVDPNLIEVFMPED